MDLPLYGLYIFSSSDRRFLLSAGEAHSLKVEKILFQGKSDYQNVMVFQVTNALGDFLGLVVILFYSLYISDTPISVAVINVWKGSCFGWGNSAH